ncbi:MAG: cytochrome c oxidase assembly protein, partial [Thiohalomonadaceae bacterium]
MSASTRRAALRLAVIALGMFGFGFALVPLYGWVCEVAGLQRAGAVQAASGAPVPVSDRTVTVRFDATVHASLPWAFEPVESSRTVRLGQTHEVSYRVRNLSSRTITAQAVPSVTPWQATGHFSKIECFCFDRQTLQGGEERE